jgi:hypothetical protein
LEGPAVECTLKVGRPEKEEALPGPAR